MATISEELNKLETTKADIKSALVEKGLNPTDVFSSYALNIRDILSGGSSEPINAVSVNYSNYNSIVWPTNWADVKLIVINKLPEDTDYISLPDLTIDLNPRVLTDEYPLIILASNALILNWKLTVNATVFNKYNYPIFYSPILPLQTNIPSKSEAIFNITINGDNVARSGEKMFRYLLGNFRITFNNAPVNNCSNMFFNMSIIENFYIYKLNTTLCSNFGNMFGYVKSKSRTPTAFDYSINTSEGTYFLGMFNLCELFNEIKSLDTSKGLTFNNMLLGNSEVIKVYSLSVKSCTETTLALCGTYGTCSVRYALIKDIGTVSKTSGFNMKPAENWGVEDSSIPLSKGAKKSLTDTLITYSFDRAAAGYSACKITLSTNTKALLTNSLIAQITAKGFTIA